MNHRPGSDKQKSPVRKQAIADLLAQIASDSGVERKHARERLVALGKPAVAPLIEALADDRDVVRWEAAKAFTDLHDPRAAPALVKGLEDSDGDVRWLAAEALVGLGRAGLKPLLEALMQRSGSVELRDGAHHVLHRLRHGELADLAEPVLKSLEGLEPDLAVPFSAETALQALAQRDR
ncbi:MAG: HEAT repeat domain-containing protein [Phycisphaerae bacterium]|nr:HEAT repeat domain-containing protein [Phycisphaerae bacterium]